MAEMRLLDPEQACPAHALHMHMHTHTHMHMHVHVPSRSIHLRTAAAKTAHHAACTPLDHRLLSLPPLRRSVGRA